MIYYFEGRQKTGPVTPEKLKEIAKAGVITPDTIVEIDGKTYQASKIKGLDFSNSEIGEEEFKKRISEWTTGDPSSEIYYFKGDERIGPLRCSHFRKLVSEGRIDSSTWTEYSGQRLKAEEIPTVVPTEKPPLPSFFTLPSFQEFERAISIVRLILKVISFIFVILGLLILFSSGSILGAYPGVSLIITGFCFLFLSSLVNIFRLGIKTIVEIHHPGPFREIPPGLK